jgi:hypothetical protein
MFSIVFPLALMRGLSDPRVVNGSRWSYAAGDEGVEKLG